MPNDRFVSASRIIDENRFWNLLLASMIDSSFASKRPESWANDPHSSTPRTSLSKLVSAVRSSKTDLLVWEPLTTEVIWMPSQF